MDRFNEVMKLQKTTLNHLKILMSWINDSEFCRLWGGPEIRFLLCVQSLVEDLKFPDNATFSLVDDNGILKGLGQILEKENNRLHLARIIIAPEERGRGLGRILCLNLIREGTRTFGKRDFSLNVYRQNKSAVRLYEGLGFRPKTNILNYIFGNDAIHMILKTD